MGAGCILCCAFRRKMLSVWVGRNALRKDPHQHRKNFVKRKKRREREEQLHLEWKKFNWIFVISISLANFNGFHFRSAGEQGRVFKLWALSISEVTHWVVLSVRGESKGGGKTENDDFKVHFSIVCAVYCLLVCECDPTRDFWWVFLCRRKAFGKKNLLRSLIRRPLHKALPYAEKIEFCKELNTIFLENLEKALLKSVCIEKY